MYTPYITTPLSPYTWLASKQQAATNSPFRVAYICVPALTEKPYFASTGAAHKSRVRTPPEKLTSGGAWALSWKAPSQICAFLGAKKKQFFFLAKNGPQVSYEDVFGLVDPWV